MIFVKKILSVFLFFTLFACGSPKIEIEKSDHFNGSTFNNLEKSNSEKGFLKFLKWKFTTKKEKWPNWVEIKQQKIPKEIVKKGEVSVTFINHATVLIQIDGVNIITDPIYSKRTSPFSFLGPKRVKLPGVKFEDLPKIDVVLISHNHYDSFDVKTLNKLIKRDNPKILFGIGNSYYLDEKDEKNIVEMDWKDQYEFRGLKFVFLPAKHWSKRNLNDANKSLWGSFAILGEKKVYFAGDTGYSNHFKNIQKQFGYFDLSLIPIGAYEPRWFMKEAHMNPKEAVLAHKDLKSKKSIGIHFGTFQLTNEAIDTPIKDLIKAKKKYNIKNDEFVAPKQGYSYSI